MGEISAPNSPRRKSYDHLKSTSIFPKIVPKLGIYIAGPRAYVMAVHVVNTTKPFIFPVRARLRLFTMPCISPCIFCVPVSTFVPAQKQWTQNWRRKDVQNGFPYGALPKYDPFWVQDGLVGIRLVLRVERGWYFAKKIDFY